MKTGTTPRLAKTGTTPRLAKTGTTPRLATPPALPAIAGRLADEMAGTGPLATLLADPSVTDVLVNGGEIWVDRGDGGLRRVAGSMGDEAYVRKLAQRLASNAGRRLDDASPFVDVRLPDGTRMHAVLPPVALRGPYLSLRTFRRRAFTLDELVRCGTLDPGAAGLLRAVVAARLPYLVTGGTGTGKTTVLASLLSIVPFGERLVIVEDAAELRPAHPHVVALQARAANVEGAGQVTLRDLVRQALRMRPDRLIVGECRGAEIIDLLGALNTGHEGGAATLHANSPADVPARLEALGLLGGRAAGGPARDGRLRAADRRAPAPHRHRPSRAHRDLCARAAPGPSHRGRDHRLAARDRAGAGRYRSRRDAGGSGRGGAQGGGALEVHARGRLVVTAIDLALVAGALLVTGWVAFWLRARSPAARLARVSREARRRPDTRPRLEQLLLRRPARVCSAVPLLGAGGALVFEGPVAALLIGVYSLMALLAVRRHLLRRDGERLVTGLLDAVDATAEGLRAGALSDGSNLTALLADPAPSKGAPFAGSTASGGPVRSDRPAVEAARARLGAAYRLSESLGVPLVELLERVEADLRSGQALRADTAAQLAGAQTSTAVLLPLPLLGLWVGASVGVDPARQLLHTNLGAACAVTAVGMQWLGLLWTSRMVSAATAEVR
nr:hypothetical protein GCM10020063_086120 [Dactylosporangium thailandense]